MPIAIPGYVPDVHSTDPIDPAWGNAIRDRAPQVFATAALRDAAITVPVVGQSCVITVGTAPFTGFTAPGEYIYAGATDGWRPPWNSPWGEMARTVDVSDQTNADNTEHVVTGAATTFTAIANRLYRIRVDGYWESLTAGAGVLIFKVKDGVTLIEQQRQQNFSALGFVQYGFAVEIGTLSAGSHTINLTHQASSGASGIKIFGSVSPLVITIDDIGPSGAPS